MDDGSMTFLPLTVIAFLDLEAVQVVPGWSVLCSEQSINCSECHRVGVGFSKTGGV